MVYNLEKFAYNRYNKFVYNTGYGVSVTDNDFKKLLPFVLQNFNKFTKYEIEEIYSVLQSEITKARSGKTFSTFERVANSDRFELFVKQILHYMSTYGLGLKGIDAFLDNPEFNKVVNELIPIETMPFDEFKKLFLNDLQNTLQWTMSEINSILDIIEKFNIEINIDKIISKELRIALIDELKIFPKNAEEFLRYLIYKVTGNTQLIKSKELINYFSIQNRYFNLSTPYLKEYIKENGYIPLAKIFNRYKPIFLAMKNEHSKSIINKISKLSKKYHKPKGLPEYLQITENIEKGKLSIKDFENIISKMDTGYLLKLGNALKFRINVPEIGIYQIRNGKVYFKETKLKGNYKPYYNVIIKLIEDRINKNLKELNIKFDLEKYKTFAIPTSGKQFTGQIPNGTYVDNFNVIGIFWKNINDKSVDLDFSMTNQNSKIGWNSDWYDNEKNIIFSGDMTDAKNGAAESYYIKDGNDIYSAKVNWYNEYSFKEIDICPFTLFFGNTESEKLPKTSMVKDITFKTNMEINPNNPQIQLGILIGKRFYFGEIVLPNFSVSKLDSELKLKAIKGLLENKIKFEELNISFNENAKEIELTKDILLKIIQ